MVGIICKNNDNLCIGVETFEGITCTEPEISNFIIKQYCTFGVFCGDYELITTVLGHVDPNRLFTPVYGAQCQNRSLNVYHRIFQKVNRGKRQFNQS